MRKIIAAMNMSLDGYCDHTMQVSNVDFKAIHKHYSELLHGAGALLYGRITFHLMEYWRTLLNEPSGDKAMDEFAVMIDRIPKIVFSHTLQSTDWNTAGIASKELVDEVQQLKQQEGRDVLVGSPGLIAQLTQAGLIDEYQLCIFPLIAGNGLILFKDITAQVNLQLVDTKTLGGGAVVLYYKKIAS